jgi:hypothetical protein
VARYKGQSHYIGKPIPDSIILKWPPVIESAVISIDVDCGPWSQLSEAGGNEPEDSDPRDDLIFPSLRS